MSHPTEAGLGDAVRQLLDGVLDGGAGYGEKPASGGQVGTEFKPYAVVYPGSTVVTGGTAADPNADALQTVQVTYIAKYALEADLARDTGRVAVLEPGALTVAGRDVWAFVELVDSLSVRREDPTQPSLWYAIDRYQATTVPA